MPYCVNCGNPYQGQAYLCQACWFDPEVLEATVDKALERIEITRSLDSKHDFTFPGEKTSLAFSIGMLCLIVFVLTTITLGIFLVLLVATLIHLKIVAFRNRNRMLQLSPATFPKLFRLAKLASYRLKIPLPPVFIRREEDYNAYTQGFFGHVWVVLYSNLVEDFAPEEILNVLGHEFTHIKKHHTTWLTLTSPGAVTSPGIFALFIRAIFNLWSLKCEYTADRGGLLVVRDHDVSIHTILKLVVGKKLWDQVNWKTLMNNWSAGETFLTKLAEVAETHPFPLNRIKELYYFSQSQTYFRIQNQF
jgi:Zn-dependent protease with chaperone function